MTNEISSLNSCGNLGVLDRVMVKVIFRTWSIQILMVATHLLGFSLAAKVPASREVGAYISLVQCFSAMHKPIAVTWACVRRDA